MCGGPLLPVNRNEFRWRRIVALIEAVDLVLTRDVLCRLWIGGERARRDPHLVAGRARHDIAPHLLDIRTQRHNQILAAAAAIRPCLPSVRNGPLPDVEKPAGSCPGRHLHHDWPLLGEIPERHQIECRLGVSIPALSLSVWYRTTSPSLAPKVSRCARCSLWKPTAGSAQMKACVARWKSISSKSFSALAWLG